MVQWILMCAALVKRRNTVMAKSYDIPSKAEREDWLLQVIAGKRMTPVERPSWVPKDVKSLKVGITGASSDRMRKAMELYGDKYGDD